MKQNAGINVILQMGALNSSGSLSDTVISKLQILWEAFPHFMSDRNFKTEPSFIYWQNSVSSVLWIGRDILQILLKLFKHTHRNA